MAVAIFWILVVLFIYLRRRAIIEEGLRGMEQNAKVTARYGELSDFVKNKMKWFDHYHFDMLDRMMTVERKMESETKPGYVCGAITFWMRQWDGVGFIFACIQIDAYAEYMPEISLRMRDEVFKAWTERPDGWKEKYTLNYCPESIKALAEESTGMAMTALTLPPEIKAQLEDKKQRKALLKKLNII